MATRQTTPRTVQRGSRSNQRDYLQELEERLKLNRGGFSTFAEDTGDQLGYILPDAMSVGLASDIPQIAGQSAQLNQVPLPQYPEIPVQEQPVFNFDMESGSIQQDFIDALSQSVESAYGSVQDQQEYLFQTQGIDYGVQSQPDGSVLMRSGEVRTDYTPPQPIQSMADGTVRFSDGTIRVPGIHFNPGLQGVLQLVGLEGQTITQDFGNYNPGLEPGSGYNLGTDVRTRDLQNKAIFLPVSARVVQVFKDDGTRFGDISGHQGYGNSVLLELPSGEMIRLSHFDLMQNFQVGDTIAPGSFIGVPGTTGNTAGEHLDLEYYNQQGQIDNPVNFTGFYDPGAIVGGQISSQQSEIQQQAQSPQIGQIAQPQAVETPTINALRAARESGGSLIDAIGQIQPTVPTTGALTSPAGQVASGVIDAVQPTGQFDPGITEGLITPEAAQARRQSVLDTAQQQEPFRQGMVGQVRQTLGNITEAVGDRLGIPEGYASEFIAGAPTQRTNQAFASEFERQINPNQSFEQSEQIKQGSPLYQGVKSTVENLGEAIQNPQEAIRQAGEGIRSLFSKRTPGRNLFSRPSGEDLSPKRAVGATGTGGDQLGVAPLMSTVQASRSMDTSDPFFKSPQFEALRPFTTFANGDTPRDQALGLDVFNQSFYQDPSRVAGVFESTYLADPALQRATESVKQAFREKYSGDEYDQGDVERILSQLPANLNYTPNLPEPKRVQRERPSLQDYLSRGKTVEQYYAETGQQSSLDSMRKQGIDPKAYESAKRRVSSGAPAYYTPQGTPVRGNVNPKTGGVSVGGQSLRTGEMVGGMSLSPQTVIRSSQRSSGGQSREADRPSLFSRASSAAGNIFKRFFN